MSKAGDEFEISEAAKRSHSVADIVSGNIGDKYDITYFISCYNESAFIAATLDTVREAMKGFSLTYDIVVIDDGSADGSPEIVWKYIADHPDMNIVFRRNAKNKGWAQNYIDSAFIGKGRYHRALCGDNTEKADTLRGLLQHLGSADIIIPYYYEVENKLYTRRMVSAAYTFLVNLLSGNSIRYYNGLPLHRRFNVMRWHPDTRGFGFQAYILCLLLAQGATFKEIPLSATEQRPGSSSALTWRNLMSVGHTLVEIFFRRISNRIHGTVNGSLASDPEHSADASVARRFGPSVR